MKTYLRDLYPDHPYFVRQRKEWFPLVYDEQCKKCLDVVSAMCNQTNDTPNHYTDYLGCVHDISSDGIERIKTPYGRIGIKTGKYLEIREGKKSILFLREDKVEPIYRSCEATLYRSSIWTQQLPKDSDKVSIVYKWCENHLSRDGKVMYYNIMSIATAEYYIIEDRR